MNMQKYQLLLTVMEMDSINRAAEYLNYTQSAVSQALLSLEREWGFQLLERSRTGVELTPNAQAILPYLREICNYQQALVENGLGVSMLSELVLRRCPYRVSIRELDQTAHRKLSAARRRDRNPAPAVKRFFEFVKARELAAYA